VGLVVWQAGFVLADLLLRRPPFGSWHGAQVLDLGCGTGERSWVGACPKFVCVLGEQKTGIQLAKMLSGLHMQASSWLPAPAPCAGLVGILLALAGAEVTLSDQPHVLPLAEMNAKVGAACFV